MEAASISISNLLVFVACEHTCVQVAVLTWVEPFPLSWRQEVPCRGQNPLLALLQPTVPGEQR